MKHLLLTFSFFLILIILIAQRNCPSTIDLAQMQTEDTDRYQRFMDLETFTANYSANQNNTNGRLANPNGIFIIFVFVHILH